MLTALLMVLLCAEYQYTPDMLHRMATAGKERSMRRQRALHARQRQLQSQQVLRRVCTHQ
jgi:hypothetical protein